MLLNNSIFDLITNDKKTNDGVLSLFQTGAFIEAYGKDAEIMHRLCGTPTYHDCKQDGSTVLSTGYPVIYRPALERVLLHAGISYIMHPCSPNV